MTKVAYKTVVLGLMSLALAAGNASLAQQKESCADCHTRAFNKCMQEVSSSPAPAAPAAVASRPGPVQASGASYCPAAARQACGC